MAVGVCPERGAPEGPSATDATKTTSRGQL
jgi:hypothetical protein